MFRIFENFIFKVFDKEIIHVYCIYYIELVSLNIIISCSSDITLVMIIREKIKLYEIKKKKKI